MANHMPTSKIAGRNVDIHEDAQEEHRADAVTRISGEKSAHHAGDGATCTQVGDQDMPVRPRPGQAMATIPASR